MVTSTFSNKNVIIGRNERPSKLKHRRIKKYAISGVFGSDSEIPYVRAGAERLLEEDAREMGYVPVLDLDTLWSTSYNLERNTWAYSSVLYCIYVGKRKAREWEGWQNGKLIPRPTQKHTSEQSSGPATLE
jgi:hypothetical protein